MVGPSYFVHDSSYLQPQYEIFDVQHQPLLCLVYENSVYYCDDFDTLHNSSVDFSGIEAEYYDDGSVLIKDYNHVLNSTTPTVQQRGWVAIGIAIIKWVGKTAATCGTIEYLSGHDICRIVINSIIAPNNDNTLRYELTGNFVSGYIPGCEPAHSSPCNAGYWEYRVIPQ